MDALKSTPGYAESQIRLLLSELNNAAHANKLIAVKNFGEYINKFKPEIYDEAMDYFFRGPQDGSSVSGHGFLYHCGVESTSHEGSLKRICAPALSLLHSLVMTKSTNKENDGDGHGSYNYFYEQFIRLPVTELQKINFSKHIIPNKKGINNLGLSKVALKIQRREALEILSLLMYDHLNADDESELIDVELLLNYNSKAKEKLRIFMKKHEAERITTDMTNFKEFTPKDIRPTTWKAVNFRPIPLQEGETEEVEKVTIALQTEHLEEAPVADPLGISKANLRDLQLLYDGGAARNRTNNPLLNKEASAHITHKNRHRGTGGGGGGTKKGGKSAAAITGTWLQDVILSNLGSTRQRRKRGKSKPKRVLSAATKAQLDSASSDRDIGFDKKKHDFGEDEEENEEENEHDAESSTDSDTEFSSSSSDDETDYEDDEEHEAIEEHHDGGNVINVVNGDHTRDAVDDDNNYDYGNSILPHDKRFNPVLLLRLVHSSTTFDDLKKGSQNIQKVLYSQNKQRENLVRNHFALFMHCVDELVWLQKFRRESNKYLANDAALFQSTYKRIKKTQNQSYEDILKNDNDAVTTMLNRAKNNLEISKIEIQQQLAPILEKIVCIRQLRYQEKTIRKMSSTILEIPSKLKQYYDIKDLKKFAEEYQKLKNYTIVLGSHSTTTTTSMKMMANMNITNTISHSLSSHTLSMISENEKILYHIQESAERLVSYTKDYCMKKITQSNSNYPDIYHFSSIIYDLYDISVYYEVLETAFLSQMRYFKQDIHLLLEKFHHEIERITTQSQLIKTTLPTHMIQSFFSSYHNNGLSIKELYKQTGGTFLQSLSSLDSLKLLIVQSLETCLLEPSQSTEKTNTKQRRESLINIATTTSTDYINITSGMGTTTGVNMGGNTKKKRGGSIIMEDNNIFEPTESDTILYQQQQQMGGGGGGTRIGGGGSTVQGGSVYGGGDNHTIKSSHTNNTFLLSQTSTNPHLHGIRTDGPLVGYNDAIFKRYDTRWNINEADFDTYQSITTHMHNFAHSPRTYPHRHSIDSSTTTGAAEKDIVVELFYYLRGYVVHKLMEVLAKWSPCLIRLINLMGITELKAIQQKVVLNKNPLMKKTPLKQLTEIFSYLSDRFIEIIQGDRNGDINIYSNNTTTTTAAAGTITNQLYNSRQNRARDVSPMTSDTMMVNNSSDIYTSYNSSSTTANNTIYESMHRQLSTVPLFSPSQQSMSLIYQGDSSSTTSIQNPMAGLNAKKNTSGNTPGKSTKFSSSTKLPTMTSPHDTNDLKSPLKEMMMPLNMSLNSIELHSSFHLPLSEPYYSSSLLIASTYYMAFTKLVMTVEDRLQTQLNRNTSTASPLPPSNKNNNYLGNKENQSSNINYYQQYLEKYKILLGGLTSLQIATKQYAKILVDKTLTKVETFCQEEWSDEGYVSSPTGRNSFMNTKSNLLLRPTNEVNNHENSLIAEFEYTLNDSFFLLEHVLYDLSKQMYRVEWVSPVVSERILKIITHAITNMMKKSMYYLQDFDDSTDIDITNTGNTNNNTNTTNNTTTNTIKEEEENEDSDQESDSGTSATTSTMKKRNQPFLGTLSTKITSTSTIFKDDKLKSSNNGNIREKDTTNVEKEKIDIDLLYTTLHQPLYNLNIESKILSNASSSGNSSSTAATLISAQYQEIFSILRMCLTLRSFWIPKLWEIYQAKFYKDDLKVNGYITSTHTYNNHIIKDRTIMLSSRINSTIQSANESKMYMSQKQASKSRPGASASLRDDLISSYSSKASYTTTTTATAAAASTSTTNNNGKSPQQHISLSRTKKIDIHSPISVYTQYITNNSIVLLDVIYEWIRLCEFDYDPPAIEKLKEIVLVEEPLLKYYIYDQVNAFRQILFSTYTCLVQEEKCGKRSSSNRNSNKIDDSNITAPSHLIRILLHLSNEKAKLNESFKLMTAITPSSSSSIHTNVKGGSITTSITTKSVAADNVLQRIRGTNTTTTTTPTNELTPLIVPKKLDFEESVRSGGNSADVLDSQQNPLAIELQLRSKHISTTEMLKNPFLSYVNAMGEDELRTLNQTHHTIHKSSSLHMSIHGLYQDYLIGEIFHGLLIIYMDLLQKLSLDYFNPPTTTTSSSCATTTTTTAVPSSSSSSSSPDKGNNNNKPKTTRTNTTTSTATTTISSPITYGQALEEYEYLKMIFAQMLPSTMVTKWTHDTFPMISIIREYNLNQYYLSKDQLSIATQLFTMTMKK